MKRSGVMAKRFWSSILTIVLMMVFLGINTANAVGYSDIENHWAKDYIIPLVEENVISGYPDGTFRPNNNITVAEFTKLVLSSSKVEIPKSIPWYRSVIYRAMERMLIREGEFDNYDKRLITRGEMARIIVREMGIEPPKVERTSFLDDNEITEDLKAYINVAADKGIITGLPDGRFNPHGKATRAEAAAMIYRMLNIKKEASEKANENQTPLDRESWVGKYIEFIYDYDNKNIRFSKDVHPKEEYIPYIELLEDGRYNFHLNWYVEMMTVSGTWRVDENNKNIVYLSKTEGINDEIILERLFDGAIALRGVSVIEDYRYNALSTSHYGNIYLREDMDFDSMAKKPISQYPSYWANIYLLLIESARSGGKRTSDEVLEILNRLDDIGTARLYDMDEDGVPELILGDRSNKEYYVLSLKDGNSIIFEIEPHHPVIKETPYCIINIIAGDPFVRKDMVYRFLDYVDEYIIKNPRK